MAKTGLLEARSHERALRARRTSGNAEHRVGETRKFGADKVSPCRGNHSSLLLVVHAFRGAARQELAGVVRISAKVTDDFGNVTGLSGRC
jgi:hypothetical protein